MVLSACETLCGDIEGRALDDGKISDNVTESDALAGCNKSRDEEALRFGLKTRRSPSRCPGMIREQPGYIRNSACNVRDDPGTSGIRPRME
jgi:hypothetical protein